MPPAVPEVCPNDFVSKLGFGFAPFHTKDVNLDSLVELSARLGNNLDLVQAGGGNTSIKDGDTLWVKASGKWLIHAADDDMFLPVPMADIQRQLAAADEKFPEYRTRSGVSLRPSVETAVHAVLPQRVVLHVHSVRTIAWAARAGGREAVAPLLSGLRWSWIPYTHPGIPLALRIAQEKQNPPDVLILENHGLVVAADTCKAAEQLLYEVEGRLNTTPRPAAAPDFDRLQSAGPEWEAAPDLEIHALGTNQRSAQIAAGGTLFPDQCVYLGPEVFSIVPGAGVITRRDLKRSARELLIAVKRVIERIPADAQPVYLPLDQVARLMNWDAEKYRIAMAAIVKK